MLNVVRQVNTQQLLQESSGGALNSTTEVESRLAGMGTSDKYYTRRVLHCQCFQGSFRTALIFIGITWIFYFLLSCVYRGPSSNLKWMSTCGNETTPAAPFTSENTTTPPAEYPTMKPDPPSSRVLSSSFMHAGWNSVTEDLNSTTVGVGMYVKAKHTYVCIRAPKKTWPIYRASQQQKYQNDHHHVPLTKKHGHAMEHNNSPNHIRPSVADGDPPSIAAAAAAAVGGEVLAIRLTRRTHSSSRQTSKPRVAFDTSKNRGGGVRMLLQTNMSSKNAVEYSDATLRKGVVVKVISPTSIQLAMKMMAHYPFISIGKRRRRRIYPHRFYNREKIMLPEPNCDAKELYEYPLVPKYHVLYPAEKIYPPNWGGGQTFVTRSERVMDTLFKKTPPHLPPPAVIGQQPPDKIPSRQRPYVSGNPGRYRIIVDKHFRLCGIALHRLSSGSFHKHACHCLGCLS